MPQPSPTPGPVAGKTILVTGATSGLGLTTAQELAAMGAQVVLGARDPERGQQAIRQISEATGGADVQLVVADLASSAGARQLVDEIRGSFDRLDVLINNAGVDVGERQVNEDGLELTFAVNYLAPFLITNGLLELLRNSAPARVINVASSGYKGAKLDLEDLQSERRFSGQRAYNNSKLALILFTYELARRLEGTGITVNAADPGFVRGTGIGTTLPLGYKIAGMLMWPFMASVQTGADTIVWAASEPSLADVTGRYLKRRKQARTEPPTDDEVLARRLWEASEALGAAGR